MLTLEREEEVVVVTEEVVDTTVVDAHGVVGLAVTHEHTAAMLLRRSVRKLESLGQESITQNKALLFPSMTLRLLHWHS